MKVFHFARFFCLTLVAVFLSFILAGNNAFASTVFPDVSDNHWAARHISKVNAMGIVGGYEDGTFRPDQAVTQLEAVLMSLRAMGETPGSNTAVPFAVPSWAERDVAKAL
ncbi:MAG: S-layer homology domain-containing protein, partial [Clostridiaceae bacterium]|nr:S-layer homology domain-containing protein [Clostridiaceae bacterium]